MKNKGNHDASHDLRGDGCEKLPHGRTLLSEACPTAVLPEKAAAFKKTPPPLRRAGAFFVPQGLVLLRQLPPILPIQETAPDGKKGCFFQKQHSPAHPPYTGDGP